MSRIIRKPVFGSLRWPAQLQRLARGLKFRKQKLEVLSYIGSKKQRADQTAPMLRLVCAFVVPIRHKTGFLMTWLKCPNVSSISTSECNFKYLFHEYGFWCFKMPECMDCHPLFFYLGLMARQDYFTHFERSQTLGGAKMGDPRKKHLTTRKQNLACLTCDPS